MNNDLLLDIMKHDELVTALKTSVLDQVARTKAVEKLKKQRTILYERKRAYEDKTKKQIDLIDVEITRIQREEKSLYSINDQYDDVVDNAPRFTQESIDLLIKFMDDYKNQELEQEETEKE